MNNKSRRKFLQQSAIAGLGTFMGASLTPSLFAAPLIKTSTPVILGGLRELDNSRWIKWPVWIPEQDEKRVLEVLRSGIWSRANVVNEFEKEWASALGVKRCLTVVNGTNALIVALNQLNVQGGDEVLVTPYTFIATIQAILANGAMPVFVDVDPQTFQMDPDKIEAKITSNTKAIVPVHILGLPCDMDRIMAIATKHNLIVLEDACQAPLAEVNHKKVGTIGHAGCFSFQNSKNIPIGEGGAIVSNDDALIDRCYSYHNLGLPYGSAVGTISAGSFMQGTKVRFSEYQAAIGLAQLKRLEGQTTVRNVNAAYLSSLIKNIPGIIPYKLYDNVTRAAFHLFPFRYNKNEFKGLSRTNFIKSLQAEGIPASGGYTTLNTQPFLKETFGSGNFKKIYSRKQLDYDKYMEQNQCPLNDVLCNEAVWFTQNVLLGSKMDMDFIYSAIQKIYENAERINKILSK